MLHFELFFVNSVRFVSSFFVCLFACGYLVVLEQFVEKTIIFPLCYVCLFVCLCQRSVDYIYANLFQGSLSILSPVLQCLDDYSIAVRFEIW